MMRQVQFEGDGGPDVIRIGEAPVPEPGSGQVLIEVAAAGVNRPDCMQRQGVYPPPSGESAIPGLDRLGCGERAQEVAEIVGEGMKLKADGVGGERAAREPRPLGHPSWAFGHGDQHDAFSIRRLGAGRPESGIGEG